MSSAVFLDAIGACSLFEQGVRYDEKDSSFFDIVFTNP